MACYYREGHLILAYGDIWGYCMFAKGGLWIMTGGARRDAPESVAHLQEDPTVVLSPKDPQDLERLRTYFLSAPFDWHAEAVAEMSDIKRGK